MRSTTPPANLTTTFSGSERPAMKLIELPEEVAKWADQNQEMVERIRTTLSDPDDEMIAEKLWDILASACSPEWREAKEHLDFTKRHLDDLNSPEKAPLGLIGSAMDSDEINAAREQHTLSLSHFTVINEGLRKREDLSRLLMALLKRKEDLDRSIASTRSLEKATARLAFADASAKEIATPEKPVAGIGIREMFKTHAARLLGHSRKAPSTEPKTPA